MLERPENKVCADCPNTGPDWASINLGIFVCVQCSGFHRNLGVHHSKVRSIILDTSCWDQETIAFMQKIGNVKAKQLYEHNAPSFYVRPADTSNPLARENWIRAKYVRKEFMKACDDEKLDDNNPAIFSMPEPAREGFMWKQNNRGSWQKRWFVLLNSQLYWYGNATDSFPKGSASVRDMEIKIPERAREGKVKEFTFHIHTPQKMYTIATDQKEQMFNWIHALLRAKIFYTKIRTHTDDAKEGAVPANIVYSMLAHQNEREGELSKQGGKFERFKSRYFVLCDGILWYFKNKPKPDESPQGAVRLENCDVTFHPDKTKKNNCFSIITPSRCFFFQASSSSMMKDWMATIRREIDKLARREIVDFRQVGL